MLNSTAVIQRLNFSGYSIRINYIIKYKENKEQSVNLFFLSLEELFMTDFNKKNMNELLDVVSRKLGVPKDKLRAELEAGKFDSALKNMKPADEAMFNRIISNPTALEQFMSSPQAKALYNKLTGGK